MIDMKQNWNEMWERVGVYGNKTPSFEDLERNYNGQGRFYHILNHIRNGLDEIYPLFWEWKIDYPFEFELSWWYHDYVYDSKRKDNEEKSWEELKKVLEKNNILNHFGSRCSSLISDTKHIRQPLTKDGRIIVDVDLTIFGQDKEIFDEYERNIRKEYSWVEEKNYKKGRTQVLEGFLDRGIYYTDYFKEKYQDKAKENLKRSIEKLTS